MNILIGYTVSEFHLCVCAYLRMLNLTSRPTYNSKLSESAVNTNLVHTNYNSL